ncbi:hypothetical protein HYW20_04915 [Candidatus Woesearchaeota archaeon]|nr:hypothetical protein [Candidatus Woesearchaeota archaeon]
MKNHNVKSELLVDDGTKFRERIKQKTYKELLTSTKFGALAIGFVYALLESSLELFKSPVGIVLGRLLGRWGIYSILSYVPMILIRNPNRELDTKFVLDAWYKKLIYGIGWLWIVTPIFWIVLFGVNNIKYNKFFNKKVIYYFGWTFIILLPFLIKKIWK